MKRVVNQFALLVLAFALLTTGCKKETTAENVDLMQGAVEYSGTYADPIAVTYTDNGVTLTVDAIPGQFIAFFKENTTDADAEQQITASGGTVLGKIPAIKFYHIEVGVSAANQFLSSMQSSGKVHTVKPNIISYPKAGAIIFDACNDVHGTAVRSALQNCAGTYEKCVNVPTTTGLGVPTSMSVNAITAEVNASKGGTTLINMSYNAGLTDEDWDLVNNSKAIKARQDWIDNMACLLNGIAGIPSKQREQLVVTLAAGNENMPVGDLLESLRGQSADNGIPFSDILKNNLLIVTTDSLLVSGIKANYAELSDPDVVIIDQPISSQGSSLAAPCAMGYIQAVMQQKGATASEALKAMKDASWMTPNREVKLGNVLNVTGSEHYKCSSVQLTGYANYDCSWKFQYAFDSIVVNWNGLNGSLYMPATLSVILLSGTDCTNDPAPRTSIMSGNLTGSNSAISGTIEGWHFVAAQVYPVSLKFTGSKNGNNIIGTLQGDGIYAFPQTVQFTLNRQ